MTLSLFHKKSGSAAESSHNHQSVRDLQARAFNTWNAEGKEHTPKEPRRGSFAAERAARAAAKEHEAVVMRT